MIPTKSDLKIKEKKSKEKENTDIRGHALQGDRLHICIPDRKKERWKSKREHLGSLSLLKVPSQKSTHPLLISHWPEHVT